MLKSIPKAPTVRNLRLARRRYATVTPSIIASPRPPTSQTTRPESIATRSLDAHILTGLSTSPTQPSLPLLIHQYVQNAGLVLPHSLPYESRPAKHRQVSYDASGSRIVMIAHCVSNGPTHEHKVTISSGFLLDSPSTRPGESLILTCAHTLEEIRRSPLLLHELPPFARPGRGAEDSVSDSSSMLSGEGSSSSSRRTSSASFVVTRSEGDGIQLHPVSAILSSLPRSDLLLLSCRLPKSRSTLGSSSSALHPSPLPVSPYPARSQTAIRAHFVSHHRPDDSEGWTPWVGGTWSKWVKGRVLGYRDFAGRETEPGTYAALSHLLFSPLPTAGSSGGPIIDEESGAVVGVMLGTRMDNRVEGVRGCGVPSESIYEMFSLPRLEGKK